MASDRYSARVGPSIVVADDVPYAALLRRIVRFTLEAAVARSADEARWEQDELRKRGLTVLELTHGDKAVWRDATVYDTELVAARNAGAAAEFTSGNRLDQEILARLDRDLRRLWRQAGYDAPCLIHNMKRLFAELEADLGESASGARTAFMDEIVRAISS